MAKHNRAVSEMTMREKVHKINIERCKALLMGDLTPYERQHLEQQIEQERSALMILRSYEMRGPDRDFVVPIGAR
jgi:hypothetical protein